MTTAVKDMFEQAKQLSAEERAELIDLLVVEAFEHPDPAIQKAWEQEIERRVESYERGEAQWIDGEEVIKALERGECP